MDITDRTDSDMPTSQRKEKAKKKLRFAEEVQTRAIENRFDEPQDIQINLPKIDKNKRPSLSIQKKSTNELKENKKSTEWRRKSEQFRVAMKAAREGKEPEI